MSSKYICNCMVGALFLVVSFTGSLAGSSKSFRDWSVYCSDTLVCGLATLVDSNVLYSFELQRMPTANAGLTLRISMDGDLKPNSDFFIIIPSILDDFRLSVASAESRDGYVYFSNPKIGEELLPAMLKGREAIVAFTNNQGKQRASLSLSGTSAAALYLDEVQDRLGKVDALVAKGDSAATGKATRAQELNSSRQLPKAVAEIWRAHPDGCAEFDGGDLIAQFGGIAIALNGAGDVGGNSEGAIYIIPCGGPGAYNLVYAGFLYDAGNDLARGLSFPTMGERGPTVMDSIINMSWDDKEGHLSAYYKGRGLGDCGVASTWQWDGNGPYGNFILIEERSKGDCDGVDDEWPMVWPIQ